MGLIIRSSQQTTEINKMTNLTTKAQWVADMMQADGVKQEQITQDLVFAYMDAIGKKIVKMQSAYLTNPNAPHLFKETVLAII